jgi:hypothetical protein
MIAYAAIRGAKPGWDYRPDLPVATAQLLPKLPLTSPPRASLAIARTLLAGDRSSATVKKDRAALDSFRRYLAEHEYRPADGRAKRSPSEFAFRERRVRGGHERNLRRIADAVKSRKVMNNALRIGRSGWI